MKITFLGAGSTVFSKNPLGDTMLADEDFKSGFLGHYAYGSNVIEVTKNKGSEETATRCCQREASSGKAFALPTARPSGVSISVKSAQHFKPSILAVSTKVFARALASL